MTQFPPLEYDTKLTIFLRLFNYIKKEQPDDKIIMDDLERIFNPIYEIKEKTNYKMKYLKYKAKYIDLKISTSLTNNK